MQDVCREQSVTELLKSVYINCPEHEASYDGNTRLSYRELWEQSQSLAAALNDLGIQKGDRVAVCLPNWNEYIVIYMAAAHLGVIVVPFYHGLSKEEISHIVNHSGAKAVFFTGEFNGVDLSTRLMLAWMDAPSLDLFITVRCEISGWHCFHELIQSKIAINEFPNDSIEPDQDVFTILYTQHSTGTLNGVMLTHSNVVQTAKNSAIKLNCTANDVFLVAVPAFHVFGIVPSILSTIAVGARMVLMEEYKPKAALELMESEQVTIKNGYPTMFISELSLYEFPNYDLSSLRTGIITGAACPVEVVKRIRSQMGCEIVVAYGMSETSQILTMTSFTDDDITRAETVGKPLPGAEVSILNSSRDEALPGEVGEIICRGFGVMKGYYEMLEDTSQVLGEDGWFVTGDLGTIDHQGNLRVVGRKVEVINKGGFIIYPREIEEILYSNPAVLEVVIVGLPDTAIGEISCACVKLKPNYVVDAKSLIDYVKPRVADYKVPDKLIIMKEFPMTASGKIRKMFLQNQLRDVIATDLG